MLNFRNFISTLTRKSTIPSTITVSSAMNNNSMILMMLITLVKSYMNFLIVVHISILANLKSLCATLYAPLSVRPAPFCG